MRRRVLSCIAASAILLGHSVKAEQSRDLVHRLIPWLLNESSSLKSIPFGEVIAATSGKKILAFDPSDPENGRILGSIGVAMDAVLAELNEPESTVRKARRVNEMSSHFEKALLKHLNARPGFGCSFPKTAHGKQQRSGYPDLRLQDRSTGRVVYLDPKLFAKGSRVSTLRTFYFEPKRETNKVTEDAHHLIVGIEQERDSADTIRFTRWELVDLSRFRVRLKAEFEGSNAELYRPEAVVGSSR